jgi:uncharacterized LabA/DUF88 family protein
MGQAVVRVRRQCGVDSTVAALLVELGRDPDVEELFVFTGDRDFEDTLRLVTRGFGKRTRVISFASVVAKELRDLLGEPLDLSQAYRVRVRWTERG